MRLEFFVWSCWINTTVSMAMGIFMFLIRPLNKSKILWGLMCLSASFWSLGLAIMSGAPNIEVAIKGKYILYLGSSFFPFFLFHFVSVITNKKLPRSILILNYLACAFFQILNIFDQFSYVKPFWIFNYYFSPKWGFIAHNIIFYSITLYVILTLYNAYRKADPHSKKQFLYLFWGLSIALLGGQTVIWPVYGIRIYPYGNFFVPFYVFFVSYAMLRYELLGFKIAFKKFSLIIFIYLCLFGLSIPFIAPILKTIYTTQKEALPYIASVIFILSAILSSGPFLFAYILNNTFWLKKNISTGLTHELKSPINAIIGASELISTQLTSNNPSTQTISEYTDIIQKNSHRLETFVSNLLNISKIQEGNLQLNLTRFSPKNLIDNLTHTYKPLMDQKNLMFETKIEIDQEIKADKDKFEQIMSNMISNAIKFSNSGIIRIELSKKSHSLIGSVEDQGKGIRPENLNKIFDRFYQSKDSAKGSGIGLTVAKAWVEAHSGKIWAESEGEGKGTKITFTFPIS